MLVLLLLGLLSYFGYQMVLYLQVRRALPAGMTMAGLNVSGLELEEAAELVESTYMAPVILLHQDEALSLDPADVGFHIDLETMLAEAESYRTQQNFWKGYLFHTLGWSWEPMQVDLVAAHDETQVWQMVEIVSRFQDEPARGPQILSESSTFQTGRPGFTTDIENSVPLVTEALYRPENRVARLVVADQEAPELSFELLEEVIRGQLQQFDGLGIVFVHDLQTGEEIAINADMAISGTSVLKIAVFLEAYRALDNPPNEFVQGLFYDTAVKSSNYGANLLLHVAAGEDNTYRGADVLTESMRRLGLNNTFMAVPYDAVAVSYRPYTYATEANTRPDLPTDIDPTMQTTAEEIGTLLSMIYYCSKGGGTLLAVYPDQLTPGECQAIIDLMVLNEEGNLIRFGVPDGVPVSHKHGWALGTHADAGIVLSPGGDYVLVEYLHLDGGWLQADISFPIMREISRAVYNYYNFDNPYLGDPLAELERLSGLPTQEDILGTGGTVTDTITNTGTITATAPVSATAPAVRIGGEWERTDSRAASGRPGDVAWIDRPRGIDPGGARRAGGARPRVVRGRGPRGAPSGGRGRWQRWRRGHGRRDRRPGMGGDPARVRARRPIAGERVGSDPRAGGERGARARRRARKRAAGGPGHRRRGPRDRRRPATGVAARRRQPGAAPRAARRRLGGRSAAPGAPARPRRSAQGGARRAGARHDPGGGARRPRGARGSGRRHRRRRARAALDPLAWRRRVVRVR